MLKCGEGQRRPHTRLFRDGEVKCGRNRGTISIDRCDLQLVVGAKRQVRKGDGVSGGRQLHLFPLSPFFILVSKTEEEREDDSQQSKKDQRRERD